MQCAYSRQAGTLEALGSRKARTRGLGLPASQRPARRSRQLVCGRQAAPGDRQVSTLVIKGQHPGHSQPTATPPNPKKAGSPATADACGQA